MTDPMRRARPTIRPRPPTPRRAWARAPWVVAIVLAALPLGAPGEDSPTTSPSPSFVQLALRPLPADWRLSLLPNSAQGQWSPAGDGATEFRTTTAGVCALWTSQTLPRSFDLQLFGRLAGGDAGGLALVKLRDGWPDWSNRLSVERATDAAGRAVVRAIALRDGQSVAELWYQRRRPYFEYALGSAEFGEEALGFRVLRDDAARCLRFYYRYEREVDGQAMQGWMEFPTLEDESDGVWAPALYVRSVRGAPTAGAFDHLTIRGDWADDAPAAAVGSDAGDGTAAIGFGARWRPYAFSGVTGDAVVVSFDDALVPGGNSRFVFWSEANYIPWWHLDAHCAVSYEFCEIWGGGTTFKGASPGGCCEPMSDRLLRWTGVEILESTPARVVVRWRYALANPEYQWWGRDPERRPEAEEIYRFYPDGVGVRELTYHPAAVADRKPSWNEIAEPMVIHRGGVAPSRLIERRALTLMNLSGDADDYEYLRSEPQLIAPETRLWDEAIVRVNLRGRPGAFIVFAQGAEVCAQTFPKPYREWWGAYKNDWHAKLLGGYEYKGDFWPFAHWPISKIPYQSAVKTMGQWRREPGHTSLMSVPGHPGASAPTTWRMLVGLTPPRADAVARDWTRSWLRPAQVAVAGGAVCFAGIDYSQRALALEPIPGRKPSRIEVTLTPRPGQPMVNPVFILRGLGAPPVAIRRDGQALGAARWRVGQSAEGDTVLWIRDRLTRKATYVFERPA